MLIVGISSIVIIGALLAVSMNIVESNQAADAERVAVEASASASRSAAALASESAAAAQVQADKDSAKRELRALLTTALEDSVLKDAKKRETEGTLTGPFLRASCTPLGGGSIDDLTDITGTFECIAVNKKDDDGTESGYVFSATVNWDTGEYQWHLGR